MVGGARALVADCDTGGHLSLRLPAVEELGSLGIQPTLQLANGNQTAAAASDNPEFGHDVLVEEVPRDAERVRGLIR